jgi:hypothetical protein
LATEVCLGLYLQHENNFFGVQKPVTVCSCQNLVNTGSFATRIVFPDLCPCRSSTGYLAIRWRAWWTFVAAKKNRLRNLWHLASELL